MQQKLLTLFDYQRFNANARLNTLINDVENRYAASALGDDDLAFVSAAGEAHVTAEDGNHDA